MAKYIHLPVLAQREKTAARYDRDVMRFGGNDKKSWAVVEDGFRLNSGGRHWVTEKNAPILAEVCLERREAIMSRRAAIADTFRKPLATRFVAPTTPYRKPFVEPRRKGRPLVSCAPLTQSLNI
jgi:hypothetical protein